MGKETDTGVAVQAAIAVALISAVLVQWIGARSDAERHADELAEVRRELHEVRTTSQETRDIVIRTEAGQATMAESQLQFQAEVRAALQRLDERVRKIEQGG